MRKLVVASVGKAILQFSFGKNSKVVRRSFSAFGQLITQRKQNHLLLYSDSAASKMEKHFSFDDYGELEVKFTASGYEGH